MLSCDDIHRTLSIPRQRARASRRPLRGRGRGRRSAGTPLQRPPRYEDVDARILSDADAARVRLAV